MDLEKLYLRMWEHHSNGNKPEHLVHTVEASENAWTTNHTSFFQKLQPCPHSIFFFFFFAILSSPLWSSYWPPSSFTDIWTLLRRSQLMDTFTPLPWPPPPCLCLLHICISWARLSLALSGPTSEAHLECILSVNMRTAIAPSYPLSSQSSGFYFSLIIVHTDLCANCEENTRLPFRWSIYKCECCVLTCYCKNIGCYCSLGCLKMILMHDE